MWVCSTDPGPGGVCPEWVELVEHGPLGLPPLTVSEALELGGSVVLLWALALGIVWTVQTVRGR